MYRSVQSSIDSVHSVKPCISGNLSVGSVTLYKSVRHCIGKGWFADVVLVVLVTSMDIIIAVLGDHATGRCE